MQARSNDKVLWVIAWCLFLFIVALAFSSCTTQRKATRYFNEHLEVAARYCADLFPVRDSLIVRDSLTVDTLWQDPLVLTDTITIKGETVYVKRPCPPAQVITKVLRRDSTVYRENTARVSQLQAQIGSKDKEIAVLQSQKKEAKEEKDWWRIRAWFLLSLIIGYVLLKVFAARLPFKI